MRTRKTVLILISGKAGAGKTTVSNILGEQIIGASVDVFPYSFASPLKYMAKAFFEWDGNKDEKGRKFLQSLGQLGREFNEFIWCKHLINQMDKHKKLYPPDFVLVDDWRFRNEKEYFKKNPLMELVAIRVQGRGGLSGDTGADISETELPEYSENDDYYDYGIDNSGSMEELENKTKFIFEELRTKYIVE